MSPKTSTLFFLSCVLAWFGPSFSEAQPLSDDTIEALQQLASVQRRYDYLLRIEGIEGTALQFDKKQPIFVIFVNRNARNLPELPGVFESEDRRIRLVARQEPVEEFTALAARMGTSTSNSGGCYAGTLGIVAKSRTGGIEGYITNAHIAAAEKHRLCPNGAETEQVAPGRLDVGMCGASTRIGTLEKAIPIPVNGVDYATLDAAFVREQAGAVDPANACGICPSDLTIVPPLDAAANNIRVRTCGRGVPAATWGKVQYILAKVWVRYRCGLRAIFEKQIVVEDEPAPAPRFSRPGFSGAVAYGETAKVVGLIFAGDAISKTLLNPMQLVLDELEVDIDTARHCR